ncbi:hypothetical protein ACFYO1_07170 [Nocardia sp. NPDC006044]|uniref:hypothetical protein n=1 Tax=Nocardia sp. NPDC006044 TaxID=3364306 RepID=UPI0036788ABD
MKIARYLAAASIAAASFFAPIALAQTAQAAEWPSDCTDEPTITTGTGFCHGGGGWYKVSVWCDMFDGGPLIMREAGTWQKGGSSSLSIAYCPPGGQAVHTGMAYRSSDN